MDDNTEYVGALDIVLDSSRQEQRDSDAASEKLDRARSLVDASRMALAELAPVSVQMIAARLAGVTHDGNGGRITDERIEMALTVLDRVGIPKLRATAIAASIAHSTTSPAPGSPGWVPPAVEGSDDDELDVGEVDKQIAAFLEGAHAARDMKGDR